MTPLIAASRSASPFVFLDLGGAVAPVDGIAVLVVGVKASLAIAKACMSGVDADGRPTLGLYHVIMSTRRHRIMAHFWFG